MGCRAEGLWLPGAARRRQVLVLQYRAGAGRTAPIRKLTIGRHGSPWTPETARSEAKRLLGMIESGADPAADKSARQAAPTMADLAERFLAEHAEAKRKARTAAEYRRLLDKIICRLWPGGKWRT